MKKNFIILLMLSFSFLHATELSCQKRLSIYLCSRLTEAAKQWNDLICKELDTEFSLFRPQDIDLNGISTEDMDYAIYQADFKGMNHSDVLLVLPPYGRDCAWEIGWFCGKEKPAIAYVEAKGDWLNDAMVKGGLTAIITNDIMLHKLLLNDPATAIKAYLISSKRDLGKVIKQIWNQSIQAEVRK